MNGEYYVFCRRCGIKVFNTEAIFIREDNGWQCKKHIEEFEFSKRVRLPTETIFKPRVVRKPREPIVFAGPILTWEVTQDKWDEFDCNWEEV